MFTNARLTAMLGLLVTVPLVMGGCKGIVDKQAQQDLQNALGHTSFTVFPTFVRTGKQHAYDTTGASRIANFMADEGLGEVTVSEVEIPIAGPWGRSQAAMWRDSAAAFAAYLNEHPADTDYAFLAEFLRGKEGGQANGIRCYVFDTSGRVAHAKLMNSHYVPFKKAKLDTVDACAELLISELRKDFGDNVVGRPKAE